MINRENVKLFTVQSYGNTPALLHILYNNDFVDAYREVLLREPILVYRF